MTRLAVSLRIRRGMLAILQIAFIDMVVIIIIIIVIAKVIVIIEKSSIRTSFFILNDTAV